MLEFLSYGAARVIAGVMTALILAMIFNHQCNKAVQFTGAATASVPYSTSSCCGRICLFARCAQNRSTLTTC